MGAQQSSAREAEGESTLSKKADYYELLGLDHAATDDEIKKAYRKKALELHPDRNFSDVENATRKFAEIQSAYEVLSDPQERAWYDSHRDAILRGEDPAETEAAPEYYNVRLTTADDIFSLIGRFNKTVPMDDSPNSFFTILRDTFDRLDQGEQAAADWDGLPPLQYPSFGESKDNDQATKAFYNGWTNFSTRLNFSWKDKWRLADAPDRQIRRLMEKENKKLREDAVREFNDAVRSLVAFVRKRDPRYVPNTQSEAERQKVLRESAAAQAARSRAANQAKVNDVDAVPDWIRSRGDETHVGEFSETEDESEIEQIECVVCSKCFKSEKQYHAHEKSKKHAKAVQQLRRQMKEEDAYLDTDEGTSLVSASAAIPLVDDDDDAPKSEQLETGTARLRVMDDSVRFEASRSDNEHLPSNLTRSDSDDVSGDEGDEYASRDVVQERLAPFQKQDFGGHDRRVNEATEGVVGISLENNASVKKMGKAKAKRKKKAARDATLELQESTVCNACNVTFDSKTKLFKHIKDNPTHAAPKRAPAQPGKMKNKR